MQDTLSVDTRPESAAFRVSTDIVVFALRDEVLQVLLRCRRPDAVDRADRALPGGLVGSEEAIDACAERILAEQTGYRDVYIEQLYTFGQPDRCPEGREVCVAYYALIAADRTRGHSPDADLEWHAVDRLPPLYLDHERIINAARERLSAKLEYSTIAFQLMPEYFTLSELQQVYEMIHRTSMDKRNFRKRIRALDNLEATERKRRNGSHRPARLYRYTARDAIHFVK